MSQEFGWTRRMVLAAKAAMTGVFALPVAAGARDMTAPTATAAPIAPARWSTATAAEMQPYIGQRFRVHTREHGVLALKLVDVQSPKADPDRPAHLPRALGVSAVFDGPDAHILARSEDATHTLSHPRIGRIDAYLKTLPRRDGGVEIEVVLN